MFLRASDVQESRPSEESQVPFVLSDDELSEFDLDATTPPTLQQFTPHGGRSIVDALREWAEAQRRSYDVLAKALGQSLVPSESSIPPVGTVSKQYVFPPALLGKALENIQVTDIGFGLPPGCATALNQAGVISVAMLKQHVDGGTLTKLPKIGRAKASVISETLRAFMAAASTTE